MGIRTLATATLDIPDLVRPVGIIHRRQKPLTPTAARFVELLTEAVPGGQRSSRHGRRSVNACRSRTIASLDCA